ncbi:beta-N-acetylglucosaminidase domain-containing protein [Halosquirtibacter laminarini]|uniref:Beta-N-acetylglucosaminidase domain-containing protein n=1 Tax=Halosquirtibacter laminarini TaxID=3374600 RepID=A0AC61NLA3_9BACT|nr:beta-N-acetylglucosaminidase domain-containing protein [Prolixibacteraceae bacterium]
MKFTLLLFLCFFTVFGFARTKPDITPTPHSMQEVSSNKDLSFDYSQSYKIKIYSKIASDHTSTIHFLLPNSDARSSQVVKIGYTSSRSLRKYSKDVPMKSGAYRLAILEKEIVLVAYDDRGLHYGLQTLKQMIDQKQSMWDIVDYPDVAYRGVVEGFYGTPWSFADRKRQLEFYGKYRLNTYIYGPKDDPFHSSPHWRDPYPKVEAEGIAKLAAVAKKNRVDFVWAIHPGKDIKWNDQDQQKLVDKLESMYQLGVRGFAVFFDDISGIGTDPNKQAGLLNHIMDDFYKRHHDLTPLIMCPTEYTKQWANPSEKGYLSVLGDEMNSKVEVMWTGDAVVGHITKKSLDWVNSRINRKAYVWWNFPVSDYCVHNLLLGPCIGLTSQGKDDMSGFVSNPMEYAAASEISLYSVANYSWNVEAFNPLKSWSKSIETLMPEVASDYKFFATYNQDANSSWGWRTGKEALQFESFVAMHDVAGLRDEFQKMVISSNNIQQRLNDPVLLDEINPWLSQFKLLGEWGLTLLDENESLSDDDLEGAWSLILASHKISDQVKKIGQVENYGRGVEVGGTTLMPHLKNKSLGLETKFLGQLTGQEIQKPELIGYQELRDGADRAFDEDINTAYVFRKVMKPGDYIGVDLKKVTPIRSIDIYQTSSRDHIKSGVLEYSLDGKSWASLSDKTFTQPVVQFTAEGAAPKARFVRYVNTEDSKKQKGHWVKLHDIFVNKSEPYVTMIFSSKSFRNMPFAFNGESLKFNKKLEVTDMLPGNKIVIPFLRPEKIKNLKINLGDQYKNLKCVYFDDKGNQLTLAEGDINGTYTMERPVKRVVISNPNEKSQAIRLLSLQFDFDQVIDLGQRFVDQDFNTSCPLEAGKSLDVSTSVEAGSILLFDQNMEDVTLEIALKNGNTFKQIVSTPFYKVPDFKNIEKCTITNGSNRTFELIEIVK